MFDDCRDLMTDQPSPFLPLSKDDLDHVLRVVGPFWRELDGARLFLTGGTGFIGTWLLETYLAAREAFDLDSSVVVLTRSIRSFAAKSPHLAHHPAVAFREEDLLSFRFPEGEFPFVIHAATEASAKVNAERPLEMFDTIVSGTRRALDFAASAGTRRFLLTSSGAVYGIQPPEISHIDEAYAGAPSSTDARSAYGEGKRAAELLCTMYPFDSLIARCFAFVGPHLPLDRHFAIGNFIADALADGTIRIRGDGTPARSYLYAADLASWLWLILFRGVRMRPYNVGSENAVSVLQTAQHVIAAAGTQQEITVARSPDPTRAPERYVPSTRRAREELGLEETIGLDDAIGRTIAWHRGRESRGGMR